MEERKNNGWKKSNLRDLDTITIAQIIRVLETDDKEKREELLKDLRETYVKRLELLAKENKYKEDQQKRLDSLLDANETPAFYPPLEETTFKWSGEEMPTPEIVFYLSVLTDYMRHMFDLFIEYTEEENEVDKTVWLFAIKRFFENKIKRLSAELYDKIESEYINEREIEKIADEEA